jgi:hypothetical protein
VAEEIKECQRIWHNYVEVCLQKICIDRHIFITLLLDGTLDVEEENWHTIPSISERAMTQPMNWQKRKGKKMDLSII